MPINSSIFGQMGIGIRLQNSLNLIDDKNKQHHHVRRPLIKLASKAIFS